MFGTVTISQTLFLVSVVVALFNCSVVLTSDFVEHTDGADIFIIVNKISYQFEEFCLLGYNTMQSVEGQPKFWRHMLPPSLGSKNKPIKKLA
jgi:hypothetical protein